MSSPKMSACHLIVVLLFGLTIAFPDIKLNSTAPTAAAAADDGPAGNCSCGGFPTSEPHASQAPLLSQRPGLVVRCSEEGGATCRNLCTALATATKAKGPEVLCNKIKDCKDLKLSAFYKICDGPWVFANMTAEEPLCCAGGAPCAPGPAAAPAPAPALPVLDANTPL